MTWPSVPECDAPTHNCEYSCRLTGLQCPNAAAVICKMQRVRHPAAEGRAPTTCWCCSPWADPGATHRRGVELGLNHTTISRRIAALEQSIGGRVLARVAGGWALTELGREARGRRGRRVGRPLADRRRGGADPGGRGPDIGDRRVQRLHRRAGGRPRAAAASQGRRRDRRRDPARHPAALRSRRRGGRRRASGPPRRGDPPG